MRHAASRKVASLLFIILFSSTAADVAHVEAQSPSHPHLFFDQAGMEAVRDRILNNPRLNRIWQKFKNERVDVSYEIRVPWGGRIDDLDLGRAYGDALGDMGIAYVALRDTMYLKKALEIMSRLADKSDWGVDLTIAHISIGFALCWDLMYDQFSEAERAMIRDAILTKSDNYPNSDLYANVNWTPFAGEGLVGLAFRGDGDDAFNTFIQGQLEGAKRNFKENAKNVLWAHGSDGFPHQGLGYWRKYIHVGLFLQALRHNEPSNDWFDLGKEYPGSEFLSKTGYPRIYADVQHEDLACITWADSRQVARQEGGNYGNIGALVLAASEYKDGFVMDFIDYLIDEAGYRFNMEDWATFLFYDDTEVPSQSYRDLPLSRYWPDMEAAIFRSGWDKNAMIFYMRCGSPGGHGRRIKGLPPGGHDHPDANGFVIFYNNDYLAAEDGASPLLGPDAGANKFTYGHNTFLIDGQGQKGDGTTYVATTAANMDYMDCEHVGYLLGNATDAYSGINRFYRYVIYKKHKYVVMVDELQDNGHHKYEFLLGTDSRHAIAAGGENKFVFNPVNGSAVMPVVFVEPRELSSSISRDRAYAIDSSLVDMLRVWPQNNSARATFFTLQYPQKIGEAAPIYNAIYQAGQSGIVVDGDEYFFYNESGSLYTYGRVSTDAKLSYYKDDSTAFEYLAAGTKEFLYLGHTGITSDRPLVAAFKGRSGKIRLGKNLGTTGEAAITLRYPGISGVTIDGQKMALSGSGSGWVTFQLSPKQHKIGPTGYEQTVTDNYDAVILTEPTVIVMAPNGGESWQVGSSQSITWSFQGSVGEVSLAYSVDNGASWATIAASTANDGSYAWTVPQAPSSECLVRISEASDGDPVDVSDGVFAIAQPPQPALSLGTPNGGESWETGSSQIITWSSQGSVGPVQLEYSLDNGTTWATIAGSTADDGSYAWTVPEAPSSECLVRISEVSDGDPADVSDGVFAIVAAPVAANYALLFDGVDDYVEIADNAVLSGGVGKSITVEAWVRLEVVTGTRPVVEKFLDGKWKDWGLQVTDGVLEVAVESSGDNWVLRGGEVAAGEWTHVAFAFANASNVVRLYVNGAEVGKKSLTKDMPDTRAVVRIARHGYMSQYLAGEVDEVRVWNYARSISEIVGDMNRELGGSEAGLIGYWRLNEGSDQSVGDATSNGNTGRLGSSIGGDAGDPLWVNSTAPAGGGAISPVLQLTRPNGGESWQVGSNQSITWSFQGSVGEVGLAYSVDNGTNWATIIASTANDGSYAWTVPQAPSSECLMRISEVSDGDPADVSDGVFAIVAAPVVANYALLFDGVDDYVEIADNAVLSGGVGKSITVEAWVRLEVVTGTRPVVEKFLDGKWKDWGLQVIDGVLEVAIESSGDNWVLRGGEVVAGEWTHVAFGFANASNVVRLYVNGAEVGKKSLTKDMPDTRAVVRIARHGYMSQYLAGEVDEVRVWNYGREGAAIAAQMNQKLAGDEAGLLAYWPFAEGSGQVAGDGTGNGSDGRLGSSDGNDASDASWITSTAPASSGPSPATALLLQTATAGVRGGLSELPEAYQLNQNYPNPFNDATLIAYDLPSAEWVRLRICDIVGQEVALLVHGDQPPGQHTVRWDGRDRNGRRVSSGVYFCHLQAGGYAAVKRMLLLQ